MALSSVPPLANQKSSPCSVVIRVCTAECNFAAPLTDPVNAQLAGNITEWAKISKQLTVWDYTVNFLNPVMPYGEPL